jgi:hypothetical protein
VPELGSIEVSVGAGGVLIVNVTVLLVPPGVVTLTVLAPVAALPEIEKVALTVVLFTTVIPLTVTPLPEIVIALVPVRLVPVRVTGTLVPRVPELGAIEVNVDAGGVLIVNVTVLLVPPGAVTLTVLAPVAALPEIAKVAVTVVLFTTVIPLTVTPLPETVIALAPVRLVPVIVTGTFLPRYPELGAIEDRTGTGGGGTSIAPMSTGFPVCLRGLP